MSTYCLGELHQDFAAEEIGYRHECKIADRYIRHYRHESSEQILYVATPATATELGSSRQVLVVLTSELDLIYQMLLVSDLDFSGGGKLLFVTKIAQYLRDLLSLWIALLREQNCGKLEKQKG